MSSLFSLDKCVCSVLLNCKVKFHFAGGEVEFSFSLISTLKTVEFSLTIYLPDSCIRKEVGKIYGEQ